MQDAAIDGPQSAQDAEQWAFAAAVGASDQQVHAIDDLERERRRYHVEVGRDDGHVVERDGTVEDFQHLAAGHRNTVSYRQPQRLPLALRRVRIAVDGRLLIVAGRNFLENLKHVADARRVSSQFDDFL